MTDPNHVGRGEWDGWIPDCPCRRCREAIAEKRRESHRPALRLIAGAGSPGGSPAPADDPAFRWASDPQALLDLAVALERLVGPGQDAYEGDVRDGITPEAQAWHDRFHRAAMLLAEVANQDSKVLRSLISPPAEVGEISEPGRYLLLAGAIVCGRAS